MGFAVVAEAICGDLFMFSSSAIQVLIAVL